MTDFTRDMLPASINSVERLAVWALEVLSYRYPNVKITEGLDSDGEPLDVFAVETAPVFVTATSTPQYRHLARHSLLLNIDFKKGGKIWEHVQDLGQLSVPTEMRT